MLPTLICQGEDAPQRFGFIFKKLNYTFIEK